jgi:hypothetical protein
MPRICTSALNQSDSTKPIWHWKAGIGEAADGWSGSVSSRGLIAPQTMQVQQAGSNDAGLIGTAPRTGILYWAQGSPTYRNQALISFCTLHIGPRGWGLHSLCTSQSLLLTLILGMFCAQTPTSPRRLSFSKMVLFENFDISLKKACSLQAKLHYH